MVSYIPGMENINYLGAVSGIVGWILYGLIILVIVCVLGAGAYYLSFNYSVIEFPLYGSGKGTSLSVGKPRTNRIKWVNKKQAWRKMFPLFNKNDIEPFNDEYIYQGKKIIAFELGDKYIPGVIEIQTDGKTINNKIKPVPHYIRNWQSLEHKKNEIEFAKNDFWSENKYVFMVLVACAIAAAIVGVAIYFVTKMVQPNVDAMKGMTSAIEKLSQIPNKPIG